MDRLSQSIGNTGSLSKKQPNLNGTEAERVPWLTNSNEENSENEDVIKEINRIDIQRSDTKFFLLKTEKNSVENIYNASKSLSHNNKSNKTLEQVRKRLEGSSLSPHEILFGRDLNIGKLKRAYLKNLIVLSFGFMLVFSAFFSLRNLQTSLNRKYSLGLFSLACMNATFAAGCILANTIIQKVRPKRVITLMLFGNTLYVASNFYPTFLTLVPATLILGFTMANLLVAQSTYLTSIAVSYASAANKRPDYIISVFNGYFLFMMYLAHFVGNLLSSVIFYLFSSSSSAPSPQITNEETSVWTSKNSSDALVSPRRQSMIYSPVTDDNNNNTNSDNCGFKYHYLSVEQTEDNFSIDPYVLCILVAIFTLITLQAHVMIGIFLDRLDVIFYKSKLGLKNQVCEIWNLHADPKMKYMLPLMIYLGFQEAFIYADFTNSYVTCSIGLHMIGFVMMAFSAMDSVTSFLCGYLRRFVSQSVSVAFGSILHLATLLFLYFWKPSADQRATVFFVAISLGIVDGIWQTLTNSLCGILFSSRQRVAVFSSLRMYQALGFTIATIYSHFLYNEIKVIILIVVLIISSVSFVCLEVYTAKNNSNQDYYVSEDRTPSSVKTTSR